MKTITVLLALLSTASLAGCDQKPEEVQGYSCEGTREDAIKFSSAVIYGIETAPPVTTDVYPIDEHSLTQMTAHNTRPMVLLAVHESGAFFSEPCQNLCTLDNALDLIRQCRDTPGCKIVGGIKSSIFYPFYTSDRNGGHICHR